MQNYNFVPWARENDWLFFFLSLASLVDDSVLVPVAGVEAFLKALQKEVDSKSAGSDEPPADTDKMEE
jgi:hypothetical protein